MASIPPPFQQYSRPKQSHAKSQQLLLPDNDASSSVLSSASLSSSDCAEASSSSSSASSNDNETVDLDSDSSNSDSSSSSWNDPDKNIMEPSLSSLREKHSKQQPPQSLAYSATLSNGDDAGGGGGTAGGGDGGGTETLPSAAPPPTTAIATETTASSPIEVLYHSPDEERQLLLLMLLAQVCALHDVSPKTLIVHVLELFEKGILDRQSIYFLLDHLGLLGGSLPKIGTSDSSGSNDDGGDVHSLLSSSMTTKGQGGGDVVNETTTALVATADTNNNHASKGATEQARRTQEAATIRWHLEQTCHFQQQEERREQCDHEEASQLPGLSSSSTPSPSSLSSSWAVKHHPLSLSRFQRDFLQVKLLNRGAFGHVFHVTSKVDGNDYAIKRVSFRVRGCGDGLGSGSSSIAQAIREVACLAQCHHEHCVRYYTSWLEPSWMTGSSTSSGGGGRRRRAASITSQSHLLTQALAPAAARSGSDSNTIPKRAASLAIGSTAAPHDNFDDDTDGYPYDYLMEDSTGSSSSYGISDSGCGDEFAHICEKSKDESYMIGASTSASSAPARTTTSQYRYEICLFIQMQLCTSSTLADWIAQRNEREMAAARKGGARQHGAQDAAAAAAVAATMSSTVSAGLEIFAQILQGLAHVHSRGIVHRDLKPANVFLDRNGKFLIGDFGLSRLLQKSANVSTDERCRKDNHVSDDFASFDLNHHHAAVMTTGIGTASYAAPEQVTSEKYGTEVDIFSLGLILLELVCVFGTYHERMEAFQECRSFQTLPSWLSQHYPQVSAMILDCTHPNPPKRPSAADLLVTNNVVVGTDEHHHVLRLQLQEKDHELKRQRSEIDEKDKLIQELQSQVKRLSVMEQQSGGNKDNDRDSHVDEKDDAKGFEATTKRV